MRQPLFHLARFALLTTTTAFSHSLFPRQSQSGCAISTYTACNTSGLPSNFCCPPSSSCIVLSRNTTVLCCPPGASCSSIQPIVCDIQQQNVTRNPAAQLHTTDLTAELQICNTGCCPLGYSCTDNNKCVIDTDQHFLSSTAPTRSATSTTTTTTSATNTSTSSPITIVPAICSSFPAPAVLVGFFTGLVAGVLLAISSFCLIGARRRKSDRKNGISDPIYLHGSGGGMRTDFLRKQTLSSEPSTPTHQPTIRRVRSLFRKSVAASGIPLAHRGAAVPELPTTPTRQRAVSNESMDISIFADPRTAVGLNVPPRKVDDRFSHQTTFTDMMARADLAGVVKGVPFVQHQSPPRGRDLMTR